jgi:hypothetical protein
VLEGKVKEAIDVKYEWEGTIQQRKRKHHNQSQKMRQR